MPCGGCSGAITRVLDKLEGMYIYHMVCSFALLLNHLHQEALDEYYLTLCILVLQGLNLSMYP